MADVSKHETSPWIAFLAGAVAVLALMLVVFGWQGGQRFADNVMMSLRATPGLPTLPHMPDAPRLPDAPIPKPR